MACRYYDDLVIAKLQRWIPEASNLKVLKPDESKRLFELTADDNKDKAFTLPLIAVSRNNDISLLSTVKNPKSFDGIKLCTVNKESGKTIPTHTAQLNVIPIKLVYQLDIYTVDRLTNDEIYRELIFYFIKHPTIEVDIPYTLDNKHVFNLDINPDIVDNSDTVEHVNKGVLYRYTSTWVVKDAYLFEGTDEYNRVAQIQVKDKEESYPDVSNN